MIKEKSLAEFVYDSNYEALPPETVSTVKRQMIALYGATIAAINAEGCREVVDFVRDIGGKQEATILMHGGKVPAQAAAFANSVMGRALDIDDHVSPGVHIGSALIPAAMAVAELIGGCSGKELITAIATGAEIVLRLNLKDSDFDGFDPTGVIAIFASTAAAAKLLRLNETQILNALALAFNRCGGSFQSNVDATLAVRIIEGWTAQMGVECARLAGIGITGPQNFLDGIYGFFHLYAKEERDRSYVIKDLGKKWNLETLNFKKYPSCGLTQSCTELIIEMMQKHDFSSADVEKIEVHLPPYSYKLVGKFTMGENLKVSAQFSAGYCVANAVVRKDITIAQFEENEIRSPEVQKFLLEKVNVINDSSICRNHYSSDIIVHLKCGAVLEGSIDIPPGTPDNPLTDEEHHLRFHDCVSFANLPSMSDEKCYLILSTLENFEELGNINTFITQFLP